MKKIKADEEVIAQLISSLEYGDDSDRKDAARFLAKIAYRDTEVARGAIPDLISLLKDENGHIRGYAACALGFLGAEDALDPLNELLDDFYTESDIVSTPGFVLNIDVAVAGVRRLYVREVAEEAIKMIEKSKEVGR
ncbi:HEAT repeat domain-containing protein [Chloroflexota bacterium]